MRTTSNAPLLPGHPGPVDFRLDAPVTITFENAEDVIASLVLEATPAGMAVRAQPDVAQLHTMHLGQIGDGNDLVVIAWSERPIESAAPHRALVAAGGAALTAMLVNPHAVIDAPPGVEHAGSVYALRVARAGGELTFRQPSASAALSVESLVVWVTG